MGGREEVWSLLRAICLWYQAMRAAGWLTGMVTGCWEKSSGLEIALIGSNFPCCVQEAQGLPNIGWQAWQRSQASLLTQGT